MHFTSKILGDHEILVGVRYKLLTLVMKVTMLINISYCSCSTCCVPGTVPETLYVGYLIPKPLHEEDSIILPILPMMKSKHRAGK